MQNKKKELQLFTKRFFPAGNYNWVVPDGCTSVDVFLVGGGASGDSYSGGGSGYTKTFKKDTSGWRDGGAISVTPGQVINIVVGKGGIWAGVQASSQDGGYSQFLNSSYRAGGGLSAMTSHQHWACGGNGGSGGGAESGKRNSNGGSDGGNGTGRLPGGADEGEGWCGIGQGHTTRDFGEPTGKRNAGGGAAQNGYNGYTGGVGGASDYVEGKGGGSQGGGGYGGGGYSRYNGGDGTVLIRYYAYNE